MGSSGRTVLQACLVLALTGCASGGSAEPPGGAANPPTAASSKAVAPEVPSPATAWPGVRIRTVDEHLAGGMMFADVEAAPDGMVFGFTFRPMPSGAEVEPVGEIALLNPATRQLVKVAGLTGPNYQMVAGDAGEGWLAWTEASAPPSLDDWTLFVQDRRSGRTSVVASAPVVDGRAIATPYVEPRLDHDLVVWSAAVTRAPLGQHMDCFLVGLAGDRSTQVLAADCFHPVISWPYVVYGQHLGPLPGGYVELTAMDLRTREHHAVGSVRSSQYYALSGTKLIYTTEGNKSIHLIDILSQQDRLLMDVTGRPTGYIQFPAIDDRLAIWDEWAGTWAFDLKRGQLVRLRAASGFATAYLRGPTLVWADYTKPDSTDRNFRVLRILDTGQLG